MLVNQAIEAVSARNDLLRARASRYRKLCLDAGLSLQDVDEAEGDEEEDVGGADADGNS